MHDLIAVGISGIHKRDFNIECEEHSVTVRIRHATRFSCRQIYEVQKRFADMLPCQRVSFDLSFVEPPIVVSDVMPKRDPRSELYWADDPILEQYAASVVSSSTRDG